jgi:hypothetical protein
MSHDHDTRPVPAEGKRIVLFGREVILIEDGRRRGRRKSPKSPKPGQPAPRWTAAEDRAVRTLSVADAVAKTGRSKYAVEVRRRQLGIAKAGRWTQEEEELLLHFTVEQVARRTGRSAAAVQARQRMLMWAGCPRT